MTRPKGKVNGKVLVPPQFDHFTGPLHERQCRDVVFLILFIAFVFGAIGYIVYVSLSADPARLLHGHDKYGNVCGRKNKAIFDLASSGKDFSDSPFCDMKKPPELVAEYQHGAPCTTCTDKCPANTTTLLFYCTNFNLGELNDRTNTATKAIFSISFSEFFETVGRDLETSGTTMAILAVIALALGLIFTLMLRFLARFVVWLTVLAMVVGSIGGTAYLWVLWHLYSKDVKKMREEGSANLDYWESFVRNLLIGAIVSTIFTVLLLALLIAMRNRIKLVIALFKEAGKAVGAMPLLMLQPLWTVLWLGVVTLAWALAWVLIATSGKPQRTADSSVVFVMGPIIEHMRWYHLFAFLWVTQFILACQDVTIAGSVAEWYFTRNKKFLGWPILTSMKRLFRYHLGSVAFGSLLIAIVKFIRFIFKWIEKRLNSTNNQFCSFCLKCCQCCLWCFEKFLKFLSRNAYIEIAIYGYSFCKAAQKAFSLLVNNAVRVAAINSVGAFVLVLTKLAIVTITIAIGYLMLRTKEGLTYIWVPLLIAFIYSYFIAHCFISVYEMCIDTLFLCFCEDCERNDGLTKPYYMSRGLMQFVENSRKALEALDERQIDEKQARKMRSNSVHPASAVRQPSAIAVIRPSTALSGRMVSATPGLPPAFDYITPAA